MKIQYRSSKDQVVVTVDNKEVEGEMIDDTHGEEIVWELDEVSHELRLVHDILCLNADDEYEVPSRTYDIEISNNRVVTVDGQILEPETFDDHDGIRWNIVNEDYKGAGYRVMLEVPPTE